MGLLVYFGIGMGLTCVSRNGDGAYLCILKWGWGLLVYLGMGMGLTCVS